MLSFKGIHGKPLLISTVLAALASTAAVPALATSAPAAVGTADVAATVSAAPSAADVAAYVKVRTPGARLAFQQFTGSPKPAPAPNDSGPVTDWTSCDNWETTMPGPYYRLWANNLADRTVVHMNFAGATKIVLERERMGAGARTTLGTFTGPIATFDDRTINPLGQYQYYATTFNAAGAKVNQCSYLPHFYDPANPHGYPVPEMLSGNPFGGFQHGLADWDQPYTSTKTATPRFSRDGRLIASSQPGPNGSDYVINLTNARTGAKVFTVALPAGQSAFDAAFSFDGQTMAFTRYNTTTGTAIGLSTVPVQTATHPVTAVPAQVSFGLAEPTWLPDGRIVAVDSTGATGLYATCPTCTAATALPGTNGALTPEAASNGTIWFGTKTAASTTLSNRTATGTVTVARTDTGPLCTYYWPRVTPDGSLFYARERTQPTGWVPDTKVARYAPNSPSGSEVTPCDKEVDADNPIPLLGLDTRQPLPKGVTQFIGDGNGDLLARSGDYLYAFPGTVTATTNGTPNLGFGTRTALGRGWAQYNAIVSVGDVTSDDRSDMFARDASGTLWLYKGRGNGTFDARIYYGKGWSPMTMIGTGDVTGDDKADLLARDNATGTLWLYPGTGMSTFGARISLGGGWNGMDLMIGSGDLTFDNKADLLVREKATGTMWLYPGNGNGTWAARRVLATGWGAYKNIFVRDLTYRQPLIGTVTSTGQLQLRTVTGDGKLASKVTTDARNGWTYDILTS